MKTNTRIKCTLHEEQYTFLIISRSFLLRMQNVSNFVEKNQNTHFVFSNFFFRKPCRLWDNVGKYCRAGQVTGVMTHALYMLYTKATDIQSE